MSLIAERIFHRSDKEGTVTVRIFAPVLVTDELGSIWSATVEILGLAQPYIAQVTGVDAFQALYLALRHVCVALEAVEKALVFEGFPASLPIVMPWTGGPAGKSELYRSISEADRRAGFAKPTKPSV